MIRPTFVFSFAAALLVPVAVQAQDVSAPAQVEAVTVFGTREARSAGSAHVVRARELERLNQDNPEAVVRTVPGVYTRSEDGIGLRPNIGIRGTNPDRSKKITLMEDGILFGPAPYSAPAAYYFPLVTRLEAVRVIKGPGAVAFGPQTVGGAIDFVTRRIPLQLSAGVDAAVGQYGYGKLHGYFGDMGPRAGYVIEGIHVRSEGWKELDGGGDAGFARNEFMWKGRYLLSTNPEATQEVRLKLGYSDEESDETYLGLTDADLRATPRRRYRASRLDHMSWHRTQIVASYHAELRRSFTIDVAAYRNDFSRTWRKVNRLGGAAIKDVLDNPTVSRNAIYLGVLRGDTDTTGDADTIFIGPNRRLFVSEGVQAIGTWRGVTGGVMHRIEAGVRYHYDRIERLHTEDGFLMRDGQLVHAGGPTLTTSNQRAWTHAVALHIADVATWGRLSLTPGLRVELIHAGLRDRKLRTETIGDPERVLIPGLGAYVELLPSLGALAGVYRGFSPAVPGALKPLGPEKSWAYEAGLRWRGPAVRVETIGFFNDYQNLTATCGLSSGCEESRIDTQSDAGRAYIYGAEAFAQADVRLGGGFYLPFTGAYTFTKTEFRESFDSEEPSWDQVQKGDELPYVPHHQASLTASIEQTRGGLTVGTTYVGVTREQAGQGDIPAGLRTDAAFLVDVTARWRPVPWAEVYLNVRNILDSVDLASRRPFGARPLAPRWTQLGVKASF